MARNKCPECPKGLPKWLAQLGDLMSLLLVFFILLLSMSIMDKRKAESYFQILKQSMGFLPNNTEFDTETDLPNAAPSANDNDLHGEQGEGLDNAQRNVAKAVEKLNMQSGQKNDQITLNKGKNEFVVDIPSTIMFKGKDYKIHNKNIKVFIAKLAKIIRTMPQVLNIEVTGFTARDQYKSSAIPRDNWDVSALRAIAVAKELMKNHIDPALLMVSARASFHPRSNKPEDNKRVELRFYSSQDQQHLLNEEDFFDRLQK